MKIIRTVKGMQGQADRWRRQGKRIGLVPTMGCLHAGHLSLVAAAHRSCDVVVVSIFVNPTQFGPGEDFARYPRNVAHDRGLLQKQGYCDAIFLPTVGQLYPAGYSTFVEETRLSEGLCGRFRPGHFRGVATVVEKLFNCVKPHLAVFGHKDYQQAQVVKRLVRDLNQDVHIQCAPTVREEDGLAMSSRNTYLSPLQRTVALSLNRTLRQGRQLIRQGGHDARRVRTALKASLRKQPGLRLDYLEVVDADTLQVPKRITGTTVIAVAARVGTTRLIDNIIIKASRT
jgi:pantoate--beta-alanine ligase